MLLNPETVEESIVKAAELICIAARTAPKGRGADLLVTAIVTGEEKCRIARHMRAIAGRDDLAFFTRDAGCVEASAALVLLGTRKEPLRLSPCGYCGFEDCRKMLEAGGTCSFNTGDLGIAIGSAVSRAADLRVDNRVMFSAGKAALELELLGEEVRIVYGVPLSVSGKSPFFDRG